MNVTMELALGAVISAFCAGLASGEPAIKDGSLVGWWRFDGASEAARKIDSSGYGGSLTAFASNVSTQEGGGLTGGCLNIQTAGNTATVTLGSEVSVAANYTVALWLKHPSSMNTLPTSGWGMDDSDKMFASNFNSHDVWHMMVERKQEGMGTSSYSYADYCDPNDLTGKPRPEVADNSSGFPVTISGTTVKIGGKIKGSSSYKYIGLIDEFMLINRMMTKVEITRLYQTGETYIYPYNGTPQFAAVNGWSSSFEGNTDRSPGRFAGAAYIIDNDLELASPSSSTAQFGGEGSKISLTLGRLAPLVDKVNNVTLVSKTGGKFKQAAANTITSFYDLRLNDGTITATADGQTLSTTFLDIASLDKPFEINVASGTYAISSDNAVTGNGVLKKTGAGTLDLTGLTGAAKVVVTEGKVLAGPDVTVTYDLEEDKGAVPVLMAE